MMKKTLILACAMALTMSVSAFAEGTTTQTTPQKALTPAQPAVQTPKCTSCQKAKKEELRKNHSDAFDKRLKLTEKQKEQAKQIRLKGHEEMKPVMEQIKAKHQEIEAVKLSRIAPQMQEEKINAINIELKDLRRKAHELRKQNMKEFEAILTPKQKKELLKMKQEGRKRFEKDHKRYKGACPIMKPSFGGPNGTQRPVPPTAK